MSMKKAPVRRPINAVIRLPLICLCAGGILFSCSRQDKDIPLSMQEYLNAAGRFWNFQGAVLAAKEGRVVFKAGYGLADAEKKIPNTPGTKYLIASITKTFTASAVLVLEEEGRLKLSDPIANYLEDFPPDTGAKITIHHILSHTSGIPEAAADPRSLGDLTRPRTPEELIVLFKDKPLEFEPGTGCRYSNSGYVLLGKIIERVSGRSYYDFVREKIFVPLGMKETGGGDDRDVAELAVGYREERDGHLVRAPVIHPSLGYSAGALYSTVEDLFKWDQGLDSEKILSGNSLKKMFTSYQDHYGYGWLIMNAWGRKSMGHGGGAPGFSSWIERWPRERAFVAVLSNNGRTPAGEVGRSLAAILFGQEYQLPESRKIIRLDPEVLDEYVGTYTIDARNSRRVVRQGQALFVERAGGQRYPIEPSDKDTFFFAHDRGASIRFFRDGAGEVSGHIFHQLGVDERAKKLTALLDRKD
jgi:CubicO group peptidase (beta-lactamase class C family)